MNVVVGVVVGAVREEKKKTERTMDNSYNTIIQYQVITVGDRDE